MYNRLRGLATPERSSLSLSLSLFSRACIRVPPLLVPIYFSYSLLRPRSLGVTICFTFPALCLSHIPWVWQCMFYISCTLLGLTLGMLVISDLLSRSVWLHCALCMYMCVCVCVCVYASTCARVGDRAICTMDSHGYVSDPRWSRVLLTL